MIFKILVDMVGTIITIAIRKEAIKTNIPAMITPVVTQARIKVPVITADITMEINQIN